MRMKVLLIHPDDDPEVGPWSGFQWDRIFDLGLGGTKSYARWSTKFGCPVSSLKSLRHGFADFWQVRDLLGKGCGRLTDQHGLDWWEIMSILITEEVETLILLQRFVESLSTDDELYISRPGLHAGLLEQLALRRVHIFPLRRDARKHGLAHFISVSKRLSTSQMMDVFWDKYDTGYQFRGRFLSGPLGPFSRRHPSSTRPMVLLPTAYINVTRTAVAYAGTLPQQNFLLLATRHSGRQSDLPPNVAFSWLASYASLRNRRTEIDDLRSRWQRLLKNLVELPEFEILHQLGYLDAFPRRFHRGLEIRDAWCNVLDTEPIQAVLCADDSNPFTRIPLLLAQERGLPNIACHHGALDGRYFYKRSFGDVILAKSKMEEDYLVRNCRVPDDKVEIGAPILPVSEKKPARGPETFHPHILFISEAFEVAGGRAREFYADVLPPLADLALNTGRKLIVKLHPAESRSERARFLSQILSNQQKKATQIISGQLTEDHFAEAWFGITILSTVATECAVRGIPCFLCRWLESWPYGYVDQFVRFGVGVGLESADQIAEIPQLLEKRVVNPNVQDNCWHPIESQRFANLLSSSRKACVTLAG
jgi:hypothetical protein